MPVQLFPVIEAVTVLGTTTGLQVIDFILFPIYQVGGLVPMTNCDSTECRTWPPQACDYKNYVFGQTTGGVNGRNRNSWDLSTAEAFPWLNPLLNTADNTILASYSGSISSFSDIVSFLSSVYPQYKWGYSGTTLYMDSVTQIDTGDLRIQTLAFNDTFPLTTNWQT